MTKPLLTWKTRNQQFSNKQIGYLGTVSIFETFYNGCASRGDTGNAYVLVPLLSGFAKDRYYSDDEKELQRDAEKMLEVWLDAAFRGEEMSLFPTDEDKAYQRGYARGKEECALAPEQCPHWKRVEHSDGNEWCCQKRLSTVIEDITPEGAAIIHQAKAQMKKKTIEEILLWRKENRGKKLGYCTNGMIEDQFLTELIDMEYWSIDEHDAAIVTQARVGVLKEALQKFDKIVLDGDCPYKYNCRDETHCEICQLKFVVESLRLAQPEPKEQDL